MSQFEHQHTDPKFNKLFNLGMSNHSTMTTKKLLEIDKGFEGLTTLVDVVGGTRATLDMIVSKYPTIKAINFDLPHVIKDAPIYLGTYAKKYDISFRGVEHVGGDMFFSVPKGDSIFMKWICHNWSDKHCLIILKNCYDALLRNGKVINVDFILPEAYTDSSLATKTLIHLDLVMLAYYCTGKERTQKDFQSLAKVAGFQGFRVCCAFNLHLMEFLKKI